jgi:hypothetical protein
MWLEIVDKGMGKIAKHIDWRGEIVVLESHLIESPTSGIISTTFSIRSPLNRAYCYRFNDPHRARPVRVNYRDRRTSKTTVATDRLAKEDGPILTSSGTFLTKSNSNGKMKNYS